MDWFEQITGFREQDYQYTRDQLEVIDGRLRSRANGRSYATGTLEVVSLRRLREAGSAATGQFPEGLPGRLKVSIVRGNVRDMHRSPENRNALFQVASQFNLLEMPSPSVTPENGVTSYQHDHTQGPACAMAAAAATIYRNYFAPVGQGSGQTTRHQIDALREFGENLSAALGQPVSHLWTMENGYALCTREGLDAITAHLAALDPAGTQALRDSLCIGVHSNVEVTDLHDSIDTAPLCVSQAFCSALPVAYGQVPSAHWKAFAILILEATYEATMWAAVLNAQRGGSKIVLLTRVGGGVFGNNAGWIDRAMRRAFESFRERDLDVRLVSYGEPSTELHGLVRDFG